MFAFSSNVYYLIGFVFIGMTVLSLCFFLGKRYAVKYLLSGWFFAALILICGIGLIIQAEHKQKTQLRSDLQKHARIYRDAVAALGHADIPLENATKHENYGKIVAFFKHCHRSLPSIPSTYTLRNNAEGHLIIFVEPDVFLGTDNNGESKYESVTDYGDPFPAIQEEADKIFATGTSYVSPEPYKDEYGTWVTALEPIFAPNERIEGILGIDYIAAQWNANIAAAGQGALKTGLTLFAFMLTSVVFYAEQQYQSFRDKVLISEQELMLQRVHLSEDAVRAKSSFLANMSHEIRTPMNAILGFTSLLLRGKLLPMERDNVHEIRRASQHLLAILNDILDIAKIESGKITIMPMQYSIRSLVNDVVGTIGIRFIQKPELRFFVEIDPQLPAILLGDELRIRQVILNLLTNAVKFTDKGFVRLSLGGTRLDDRFILHIDVQDTGRGIKAADKDKLFRAFEQVDTHRNRQLEGTGLGLAISHHIVEMCGGTMSVETQYNEGSTFSCKIPQDYLSCKLPQGIPADEAEPLIPYGLLAHKNIIVYEPNALEAKNWQAALESLDVPFRIKTFYPAFLSAVQTGEFTHYFIDKSTALKLQAADSVDASRMVIVLKLGEQIGDELSQSLSVRHPISSLSISSVLLADNSDFIDSLQQNSGIYRERFIAPSAKILVVDDNETNLRLAAGLLEPYQCQVQCVSSGKEAIDVLKKNSVDIVFMDHMMPEMDGVEAVQFIRTFDNKTPIIALTANVVAGVKEMYYEEGFSDFIPKPIEIPMLEHILKTWLPKHKIDVPKLKSATGSSIILPEVAAPQRTADLDVQLGIKYSGGNGKLHRKVCESVSNEADPKLEAMTKAIAAKDWHRFTVEVHAVKSSTLSIGAVVLSEFAKQLEAFGKESNEAAINADWQEFLRIYSATMQKIRDYLDG